MFLFLIFIDGMFVMFLVVLFYEVVGVCSYIKNLKKMIVLLFFKKVFFLIFLYSLLERNAHYKGRNK